MPRTTEFTSAYYRVLIVLLVLCITVLVLFDASDNWGAIIACLVCLALLGVRLAYTKYLRQQTQRARPELPPAGRNSNDDYNIRQNNNLPGHSRLPDAELEFGEYMIAREEDRRRQNVFTISIGHDPPPDYDSVTKDQRPPRLPRNVRADDSLGIHHPNSNNHPNSLPSSRSRQGTASRSGSNSSSPNSLSREPDLTQEGGRISENWDSIRGRVGVQGMDDSQPPPSYDEALAARIYQQLGLENR